jgi:hypothetical protein
MPRFYTKPSTRPGLPICDHIPVFPVVCYGFTMCLASNEDSLTPSAKVELSSKYSEFSLVICYRVLYTRWLWLKRSPLLRGAQGVSRQGSA